MEFYTYVNIFETKGLEYLLLMAFFVLFVLLLRYLSGVDSKRDSPDDENRGGELRRAAVSKVTHRGRG